MEVMRTKAVTLAASITVTNLRLVALTLIKVHAEFMVRLAAANTADSGFILYGGDSEEQVVLFPPSSSSFAPLLSPYPFFCSVLTAQR